MVGKVILLPMNAATGAVRLALNVTAQTVKVVGGVVERAMGVTQTPAEDRSPQEATSAPAQERAASSTPAQDGASAPAEERADSARAEDGAASATSEERTAEAPEEDRISEAPEEPPAVQPDASKTSDEAPETSDEAPEASGAAPEASHEAPETSGAAPEASPSAQPAIDYDAAPPTPIDRAEEVAKTIDDEPELVGEFAEPGAEDGAGASATVEEPWDGYADMNADAVIARIDEADLAELAVLELYERAHRKRQTVLEAAERRHRALIGPGSGG